MRTSGRASLPFSPLLTSQRRYPALMGSIFSNVCLQFVPLALHPRRPLARGRMPPRRRKPLGTYSPSGRQKSGVRTPVWLAVPLVHASQLKAPGRSTQPEGQFSNHTARELRASSMVSHHKSHACAVAQTGAVNAQVQQTPPVHAYDSHEFSYFAAWRRSIFHG